MNSMGDQSSRNLRRPLTAQELIDSQTMKINNPNIMGSGFIQHPPQRPFQQPIVYQPPSVAHLEYPQEYMEKKQPPTGSVPRPEGVQAEQVPLEVGRQAASTQQYESRQDQYRQGNALMQAVEPQRNVQDEAKFYDQKSNYISDEYLEPLVRARLGMDQGNQNNQVVLQNGGRNGEYPVRLKEAEVSNARIVGYQEQQVPMQLNRPPSYGQLSGGQQKIQEPQIQPRLPQGFQSAQRGVPQGIQGQVVAPQRVGTALQAPVQRRVPEAIQRPQPVYSNAQMQGRPPQAQRQQAVQDNVPVNQRQEVEPQRQQPALRQQPAQRQPAYNNVQQVQRRNMEMQGQQANIQITSRIVEPNRQQPVYGNTQLQRKDLQPQRQQVSNPSNRVQQQNLKQPAMNGYC
eukprot:TRINITY_DN8990_c0_g1_i10.p1 TRINITY_DN8990_c0_g1~~TRINITY_DN8990_c0_g1_i10.p1  ORF type:complete len:459 (-),score=25.97 TRINITY_DN8990_c0_g1_i10:14-1213(-)